MENRVITHLLRRTYTMNHTSNFTPSNEPCHEIRSAFTNSIFICEMLYFKAQNITEPNTLKCVYSNSVV